MKYLLFVLTSVVIHSLSYFLLVKKELINSKEEEKREKYTIPKLLTMLCVLAMIFFLIEWRLFTDLKTNFDFIRMTILYAVIVISALIDYKCKIIPNKILLVALIGRLVLYIPEFIFMGDEFFFELLNEGLALMLSLLLTILSLISKKGIGMGDIKLFAIIALYTGAFFTYSILFVAVLVGAIFGGVMLLFFHKDKKTTFPFGPLILLGYIVAALAGSY